MISKTVQNPLEKEKEIQSTRSCPALPYTQMSTVHCLHLFESHLTFLRSLKNSKTFSYFLQIILIINFICSLEDYLLICDVFLQMIIFYVHLSVIIVFLTLSICSVHFL